VKEFGPAAVAETEARESIAKPAKVREFLMEVVWVWKEIVRRRAR